MPSLRQKQKKFKFLNFIYFYAQFCHCLSKNPADLSTCLCYLRLIRPRSELNSDRNYVYDWRVNDITIPGVLDTRRRRNCVFSWLFDDNKLCMINNSMPTVSSYSWIVILLRRFVNSLNVTTLIRPTYKTQCNTDYRIAVGSQTFRDARTGVVVIITNIFTRVGNSFVSISIFIRSSNIEKQF